MWVFISTSDFKSSARTKSWRQPYTLQLTIRCKVRPGDLQMIPATNSSQPTRRRKSAAMAMSDNNDMDYQL